MKRIVLTVLLSVMLLQMTSCSSMFFELLASSERPYVINIQNTYDYNSDKCRFTEYYFLEEIPECAEITDLSYFEYFGESFEQYIELKFEDYDSLNGYLTTIKEYIVSKKTATVEYDKLFIEEKNPYNDRYMDIFYAPFHMSTAYESYTGYSVKVESKDHIDYVSCYFIISYSYDDLTVHQSYTMGTFCSREEAYVPMYLRKFNVPFDKELERLIYVYQAD